MGKTNSDLTNAEWAIMEYLWENSGATSRSICSAMTKSKGWSRSTTLTMLQRLEHKMAISCNESGAVNTYSALLSREEAAGHETDDLLERVYHGSLGMMVSALTRRRELSDEEINELYAILKNVQGGGSQ